MGSLIRKFKRKALKNAHTDLGKFLQQQRSLGHKTLTVQGDDGKPQVIPLPSKPPLGLYIKRAEAALEEAEKKGLEKREEAEKKVDLKWKEET
jgi:hypothetical protein